MANRRYNQFFNTLHTKPILIDCNFVVDATNGAGVTGLKGPGIQAIYMHTSTTPVAGNPNPPAGYILAQLQDSYNLYYSGGWQAVAPLAGSALTSTTSGDVYVINALGTTTLAQWQAAGLPVGVVPAVGVPFVAIATGAIGGTGSVKVPGVTGIGSIEVIGTPNETIVSSTGSKAQILGVQSGAYMMFQILGPTSSSDTTPIPVAPTAGSVIHLEFYFSGSRITVQGE